MLNPLFLKLLPALAKPFLRPRVADGKLVNLLDHFLYAQIRLAPSIGFHKPLKFFISGFITFLQKLPHHIRLKKSQLPLVPYPERGIDIQPRIMVSDQGKAEAVDGLDLGVGN